MVVRILLVIFLFALHAFAAEAVKDSSAVPAQDTTLNTQDSALAKSDVALAKQDSTSDKQDSLRRTRDSAPLPRQSAYTGKGLVVGLAAGIFSPTEECDCLGVWQGQVEYFYRDWVSAGVDVRFFGGNLDTDVMVRYQRYRINTLFHFPHSTWDWYIGPIVGLENMDLEDIREEWHNRDVDRWIPGMERDEEEEEEREVEECERMFSLDGFSIGIDAGIGVAVYKVMGFTGSVLYEYNFGGAQLLTIAPGLAFNLQEIWPWANRSLLASWVTVEAGFQRYFNRSVDSWAMSIYLGAVLGF